MSDTTLPTLDPVKLLIGGEAVDAQSGATFTTVNPATEEVLTTVASAGEADVDAAVKAARAALSGKWGRYDGTRRQNAVYKLGMLVQQNAAELAMLETLDTGKTQFDSGKVEIPLAGEVFKYFAGWANKVHGTTAADSRALKYTLRQPVGVVGAIIPWNFPLLMAAWKVAPALAMGNTVVLKPAELTPLTANRLGELALEAGIPPGVLNIVHGVGSEAGAALVNHPGVNKIAFTGSTAVGQGIMRASADTLKRVSLELGGKSPNIIFDDADLKAATRGALGGIFYNKGEVCAAGSRLLVQRGVYDQVVETLAGAMAKYTLGNPLTDGTRMGPVISAGQMERVLGYIEAGKSEGAKLVAGGGRALDANDGKGYFVQPTIFADVDNKMKIAQEEIFGPVLSVIPFDDEADALAKANDIMYGLAAGVWTSDVKKALRVAHGVEAGTVWVNAYNLYDPALPFGGFKSSGFGRDLGQAALEQYTETKSVWVDLT